ncbi:MAG: Bor protein [Rikenellaceae bacterium]
MKRKITNLSIIIATAVMLQSCYSTRLYVGDITTTEPLVEVNKVWNHHVLFGLVPLENASMKASEYVNDAPSYMIKTNTNVLNYIVSGVTFGIYTPTQTKYYLPLKK